MEIVHQPRDDFVLMKKNHHLHSNKTTQPYTIQDLSGCPPNLQLIFFQIYDQHWHTANHVSLSTDKMKTSLFLFFCSETASISSITLMVNFAKDAHVMI